MNELSNPERERILEILCSPKHRDLSPQQIVPLLPDEGTYLASESTMYRILREKDQLAHREPSQPRRHRHPREQKATGPNQV